MKSAHYGQYLKAVVGLGVCLALLSIVLAGCGRQEQKLPIRFAIIGDRTVGHEPGVYGRILKEIQRLKPEFIMTVGDAIEGYTDDTVRLASEWEEYLLLIDSVSVPIHHTPGNHDIFSDIQEDIYRRYIGKPYYSFDHKDLHMVVLDNSRWPSSEELADNQIQWLIDDLRAAQNAAYIIVFMHKPFWYNSTALGEPDVLHSIFHEYGVDAVFTGHFHNYFSGTYDDIIYTSLGSSGGEASPDPTGLYYHHCWVTVDDDGITIAPIKEGSVLPWDITNADEYHLISKAKKFGFEFEKIPISMNLNVSAGMPTLTIHNGCTEQALDDTLRWSLPPGWTVRPAGQHITVPPMSSRSIKFRVSCDGPVYPLPKATLSFPYAPGKFAEVTAPLLVSRQVVCFAALEPPTIDGALSENVWRRPTTRFFDKDGGPATTDPVEFYYAYDEENLYVAARCDEAVMDSLTAEVTELDGSVYREECIGLFLQPDMNKNVVYQVYFNPLGTVFDQRLTMNADGYYRGDRRWTGNYRVKALRGDNYWSIEAAIRLDQFGVAGRKGEKWGLNFRRKQSRLNSAADWQTPIDYDPKSFGVMIMN